MSSIPLDELALHQAAQVLELRAPAAAPEWARWLAEIGFIPGERVMLLARGRPGGDPLVVRIGDSTFALRRAEAVCIRVEVAA
jgi:ferrous iron transport protein A